MSAGAASTRALARRARFETLSQLVRSKTFVAGFAILAFSVFRLPALVEKTKKAAAPAPETLQAT